MSKKIHLQGHYKMTVLDRPGMILPALRDSSLGEVCSYDIHSSHYCQGGIYMCYELYHFHITYDVSRICPGLSDALVQWKDYARVMEVLEMETEVHLLDQVT